MLDKLSELVLRKLIELCGKKPEAHLEFDLAEFDRAVTEDVLIMILNDLEKNEYLEYSRPPGYGTQFSAKLTYKGYAYFQRKHIESKYFLVRSVVLPIIITIITQLILWGAKELYDVVRTSSEEHTANYACHYYDNCE